ncbi:hypothetical protein DAPPUDRAFT_335673 [Daphnia pulex]|uniref:Photolyase/cryptochrome alpha/beta domain-containing protein n=1 Tax=Daphnia pulex TaxID=6669 RepID=E9HY98_DAPPU|nr:hypothetical protein DAPPUDRAFT_335673 [Daphnia pulex]|eukprot:EFX63284.1 hypothetical protein DAPPUDRAFT_335673 [Daphnia pulex]
MNNKPVVTHWFRKGLHPALLSFECPREGKIVFNHAFQSCVGESNYELRPVKVILDPWFVKNARMPRDHQQKYFKEWNIKKLTFEVDIEPYAKTQDEEIKKLADHHSVPVVAKVSHTIYDLVFKANGNKAKAEMTKACHKSL